MNCLRCGKTLVNGRGGCEGAQHGNRGCAMNNPAIELEPCRWCGVPVAEQTERPADYCVHDGLWHEVKTP